MNTKKKWTQNDYIDYKLSLFGVKQGWRKQILKSNYKNELY